MIDLEAKINSLFPDDLTTCPFRKQKLKEARAKFIQWHNENFMVKSENDKNKLPKFY